MKWVSRQLMLPILLGASLTGVGIVFIYSLYKKDDDEKFDEIQCRQSRKHVAELKVPRQFVPAIIGRGGTKVKEIQSQTGTQIRFKEDDIESPDRICVVKGNIQDIRLAEEIIKTLIANLPVIETYEMYVPHNVCSRIIGKGGATIQSIQIASSAKITVERSYALQEGSTQRRIIIKGTAEQIATALSQIEDKVREEKEIRSKLEASSAARLPRGKLSPHNTAVNHTSNADVQVSPPLQIGYGTMEVYVSAMETPSQFWVQVFGPGTTALDKLVAEMTAYYNEEENREIHILKNINLGQMVAARFSYDEQWYRAEVISTPNEGFCEVYFVDYGDRETINADCILELRTDFLSLRLQAVECSLANVKPRENEWSPEACDKFSEITWLAQWKVLVAKVIGYKERTVAYGISRREGSPIPCVDLYDKNDNKDINVAQEMINEGFAEEVSLSAASSTLSVSTRGTDVHGSSRATSTSPLPKRTLTPEKQTEAADSSIPNPSEPRRTPLKSKIEEIDLTSTPKHAGPIEEIDLVTPEKNETTRFIETERKVHQENGGGPRVQNGSTAQARSQIADKKIGSVPCFAPAGYESDLSHDSDEFELG